MICEIAKLRSEPRGYFQIRRSRGGVGPHIKFEGKIWGKVRPSSQDKRKNLGSSVTKRSKSWENVPILGSYLKFRGQNLGYLSFILLEAKFGAPTRISEAKFRAKPPNFLIIWKYPPGVRNARESIFNTPSVEGYLPLANLWQLYTRNCQSVVCKSILCEEDQTSL